MVKKFTLLALTSAVTLPLAARQLTPQEALQVARQQIGGSQARVNAAPMQLVLTSDIEGSQLVYIFANPGEQGFIIAAGDDAVTSLLGYSETALFDADNLAPAFRWWIDQYARQIAWARENGNAEASAPARAERAAVTPLCKTTWDQSSPYNNMCPTLGTAGPGLTGCVATAVAQVMKVYEWPETGTGSNSYSFSYGGRTYSASANFGATTYDWANMLNSYSGSSTTAQQNAVATLMYQVGVMSNMKYNPYGSGTTEVDAAVGLINHMGYDKAMRWLDRKWFTVSEWNDLVYAEVAAGRPVLYGGDDGSEGHEFVCDGYRSDDYFHINWGWSGTSDGYFLLSALNPPSLGAGGGNGGYNYNQSVVVGIQPAKPGSEIAPVVNIEGNLTADCTSYTRNSATTVTLTTTGGTYTGFYSDALTTLTYTFGVECAWADGTSTYITASTNTLQPMYGINTISVPATSFPVGQYKVYPVAKATGYDWQRMYYESGATDHLRFEVTETSINTVGGEASVIDFYALGGSAEVGTEADPVVFEYTAKPEFDVAIKCTIGPWEDEVSLAFFDLAGNKVWESSTEDVSLRSNRTWDNYYTGPWSALSYNTAYRATPYGVASRGLTNEPIYFMIKDKSESVAAISADADAPARYYNLQGIEITNPQRGQLLILRQGDTSTKVIY